MIDKDIELHYAQNWAFYWTSGTEEISPQYVEKHYKLALARIAELEAILDRDAQAKDEAEAHERQQTQLY